MAAEEADAAVGVGLLVLQNFHTAVVKMVEKELERMMAADVMPGPLGEWSERDHDLVVINC